MSSVRHYEYGVYRSVLQFCSSTIDSPSVFTSKLVLSKEYFSAYAGKLDECISGLRKFYKLDAKAEPETAEEAHEDWTLFQNAIRLIQVCGKPATRHVTAFMTYKKALQTFLPQYGGPELLNCILHVLFVLFTIIFSKQNKNIFELLSLFYFSYFFIYI